MDCFEESVSQLNYADNVFECDTMLYAVGACVGAIVIIIFIILFLKLWKRGVKVTQPHMEVGMPYVLPRNPGYRYGLNLPSRYLKAGTHAEVNTTTLKRGINCF